MTETDEEFVRRSWEDMTVMELDFERLFALARRGAEAGKLLAEQDHEYIRKTNALIARHANEITRLRAAAQKLEDAANALIDFHNAPLEARRPDIHQRLMQRLADALPTPPKGESDD